MYGNGVADVTLKLSHKTLYIAGYPGLRSGVVWPFPGKQATFQNTWLFIK